MDPQRWSRIKEIFSAARRRGEDRVDDPMRVAMPVDGRVLPMSVTVMAVIMRVIVLLPTEAKPSAVGRAGGTAFVAANRGHRGRETVVLHQLAPAHQRGCTLARPREP